LSGRKNLLEQCDLVKFAKYIPELEVTEKDFSATEKFIDDTTPAKAESTEDDSDK